MWRKITATGMTLFLLILTGTTLLVTLTTPTAYADFKASGWDWVTDCSAAPPPSCDPTVTITTNQTTGGTRGAVRFNVFYRNTTGASQTSSGTSYDLYCTARGSLYETKVGSATGASSSIGVNGTISRPSAMGGSSGLTCSADGLFPRRLVVTNTWSGGSAAVVLEKVFGAPGTSTGSGTPGCTFGQVRASYIDGEFRIYFEAASGATQGWEVFVPDPGNGATNVYPLLTIPNTMVTGATNWYGGRIDMPVPSALTYRVQVKGNPNCFKTGVVSTSEIAAPDYGGGGTGEDADYGCDGWNPLSYLKCLFIPQSAGDEFIDLWDELKVTPPVSFITGGISWFQFFYDMLADDLEYGSWSAGWACDYDGNGEGDGQCGEGRFRTNNLGDNEHLDFDVLKPAGDLMQDTTTGQIIWKFLEISIWVKFALWAWGRVGSSFGSKDLAESAE